MHRIGVPITRDNYIALNSLGEKDPADMDAEDEGVLPHAFQRGVNVD